jgi:hypothetical protein
MILLGARAAMRRHLKSVETVLTKSDVTGISATIENCNDALDFNFF